MRVSARHFYPKKPVNCDSWNWFLLLLERLFCCLLSSELCTFWKFSVPDQIVGWPRSRKNLVAEGGHTLPLSPCQLGQLGYFSLQPARRLNIAPQVELRFPREECCCWDSLVSTFPARLFFRSSSAYQTYTQSSLCLWAWIYSWRFPFYQSREKFPFKNRTFPNLI